MARPPKGKALTLRPIRLDDDVWAECQRLGKEHGTINEGVRVAFGWSPPRGLPANSSEAEKVSHDVQVMIVSKAAAHRVEWAGPILKPKDRK